MLDKIAGQGRKRPLLNIPTDRLHPDPENPRLQLKDRGKHEKELLLALKRHFDLDELAYSMAENGYFDEEPLVGIPDNLPKEFEGLRADELVINKRYYDFISDDSTQFRIAEGNRRLSTVKILLSEDLQSDLKIRNWPAISEIVRDDLSMLPVIVYPTRREVLPYLGVRHITGIKKWDAFSKALYVADMVDKGYTIDAIQQQVGDTKNNARKTYVCYKLVDIAENELDLDTTKAKDYFSYLLLSLGQPSIKEYIGLPKKLTEVDLDNPIPNDKTENLKDFFSWLFGEGTDKLPVIRESRDITNYLSYVLKNEEAIDYLKKFGNLLDAYDRSDGEKDLLLKNLQKANKGLETSLGIIHRYKGDEEVKKLLVNCNETLDVILKNFE